MSLAISKRDTYIDTWDECYISEQKQAGYVVTLDLSNEQYKQIWYGLNDVSYLLKASKRGLQDVYLSLNAFTHGSRKSSDLKQIRNIGVDLDFYKIGLSKEYVREQLNQYIYSGKIPCPNLVMQGRGIQLIYSISGGAAPQMAYLTQYITNHFIKILMPLGADGACSDLSRVFRLPNSVHSKTGKRITADIWSQKEYSLQELYEYVPPLEKKRKAKKATITPIPSRKGVMTLYSLNLKRKIDLERIVHLRNGVIENRNDLTYIYSFTTALIVKNQAATLQMVAQLNDKLVEPQSKKEVERTAKNAYKDAMTFFDKFVENGLKMSGLPRDLVKPMKNTTIVEKMNLNLTEDELSQLDTLINSSEKYRRKVKKRRESGMKTREEYVIAEKEKLEDKLRTVKQAKERCPLASIREIASYTGFSKSVVARLLKQL
ncbi:AsnC family protein [Bacillus cereus]|uniref:AsnC family protein n=1 Tax=Bacillus cereus TaxID=1396 RepID=UPI0021800E5A|nr:AsnC family protein [Bacillus cereus]UWJ21250.1 Replication protein [Bacillus cereus]